MNNVVKYNRIYNLMNFPVEKYLDSINDLPEYDPSDENYDWGLSEDGRQNPSPCPICGTLYYACTVEQFPYRQKYLGENNGRFQQ